MKVDPKAGDLMVLQAVQSLSEEESDGEVTAESIAEQLGLSLKEVESSLRTLRNEFLVHHQALAGFTETGLHRMPGLHLTRKGEDKLA